jgi:hypothetical protein
MSVIPYTVWADDPNDEILVLDGVSYHVLRSTEDWERFRQLVIDANGNSDVNAIMLADFTVTDWVGLNEDAPYQGIFNGNGHTLNLDINNPNNDFYMAPFVWAVNATIRNLRVTGTYQAESTLPDWWVRLEKARKATRSTSRGCGFPLP